MLELPWFPWIPDEVHPDAGHLHSRVCELGTYCEKFYAAVELFQFGRQQLLQTVKTNPKATKIFSEWERIAARDAVMTVFHISHVLQSIKASLNEDSLLKQYINKDRLKAASKRFFATFKDFEDLRHAVAHSGETTKDRKSFDKNAFSGSFEGLGFSIENFHNVFVGDHIADFTYAATHNGRFVSLNVDRDSLMELVHLNSEIQGIVLDAIAAATSHHI